MQNYQLTADLFLQDTGTKFECKFLKYDIHFDGDKYKRDIYEITLSRGQRKYTFNFGQSINASGRFWKYGKPEHGCSHGFFSKTGNAWHKPLNIGDDYGAWPKNPNFKEPTAYDVLACLTKNDPGTFENFCGDFGYESDSRTAEKIYKAVVDEWNNIKMLFTDEEIEKLQEIN